jgi:hypothetical protein
MREHASSAARARRSGPARGGAAPWRGGGAALALGEPGDAAEREADRIADRIMRMPDPTLIRRSACACGGGCPACGATSDAGRPLRIERSPGAGAAGGAAIAQDLTTVVARGTRGGGQALDPDTRAFMEARFGHDFGHVRVHADGAAAESARAISAAAYTVGPDIVFDADGYAPRTDQGRRTLAHELAHVVQQSHPASVPSVQRQGAPAPPCPTGIVLSSGAHAVQVPPCGTRPLTASVRPVGAPVTWSLANGAGFPGAPGTVVAGTSISAAGAITIAPTQGLGYILVSADGPAGCRSPAGSTATGVSVPLNLASTPTGVSATTLAGPLPAAATQYGARFAQELISASGNPAHLLQVRVNERFSRLATPNASTHAVPTPFGTFTLHSNPWTPNSDAPGWDITDAGIMSPDNIGTDRDFIDVGRFVASASNPTPATTLSAATPVGFSVQQDLHWFCPQAAVGSQWITPAFATLTHTRQLFDLSGALTFVTGIPSPSLAATSDAYTGQPAFIHAAASPNPVTVSPSLPRGAPRGTPRPTPNTTQVTADTLPSSFTALTGTHDKRFAISGRALGCSVDATTGEVTVGTTPGTITVRARDVDRTNGNFDEVRITIAPPAAAPPAGTPPAPSPGAPAPSPGAPPGAPAPSPTPAPTGVLSPPPDAEPVIPSDLGQFPPPMPAPP